MLKNIRRAGAVTAVALLSLGLASCSGGQSVAEACTVVESTMNEAVSDSNAQVQSLMSDLTSGEEVDFAAAFAPVQDALADAQDEVTNAEVSEKLDLFVSEYNDFISIFNDFDLTAFQEISELSNLDYSDPAALEKVNELQAKAEALQAESEELTAALQDKQATISDTTAELQSLCNG